jgi:hypothetical protein
MKTAAGEEGAKLFVMLSVTVSDAGNGKIRIERKTYSGKLSLYLTLQVH